jgi:uncharacterized membrane protein YeiH
MDGLGLKIVLVVLGIISGAIGGFINVLMNNKGEFVHKYQITDEMGRRITYWGNYKEIIIGAIAGPLAYLPILAQIDWWNVLYVSIFSGAGGSMIFKNVVDNYTESAKQAAMSELSQVEVKTLPSNQSAAPK